MTTDNIKESLKNKVTKTAREYLKTDTEFEEGIINEITDCEVEGFWFLATTIGASACPKRIKVKPKIGQTIRFYGDKKNQTVRGITIGKNIYRYQTPDEEKLEIDKMIKANEKIAEEEFKRRKDSFDTAIGELHPAFQERIQRFRDNNPTFRRDYEPYELFCCQEATKFANKLKTVENIVNFTQMPVDAQSEVAGRSYSHSGNTFECSIFLAKLFVSNPESINNSESGIHGALCPLIGCEKYGCVKSDNS